MPDVMDAVVNLCKRRGFIFPSAEIYGGFRSAYDYGPLGSLMLRNVRDAWWRSQVAGLTDPERAARLAADAQLAAEIPRWYLRRELRSFDHIHPNREGHRLIAETVCPRLPASWGCRCGSTTR